MPYGEIGGVSSPVRRNGVSGDNDIITVGFTTAGGSDPTVNSNTKGVTSVLRTGTGVITITLPITFKSLTVAYSRSPTSAQEVHITKTATTVVVTTATAGGSTAADTTGISIDLIIVGEVAGT